jgi:hypothetical protein
MPEGNRIVEVDAGGFDEEAGIGAAPSPANTKNSAAFNRPAAFMSAALLPSAFSVCFLNRSSQPEA